MDGESLLGFVRFHAWANDKILTTTAGLSDEELRRPNVLDHGSAFETIRHVVDVDWSWREFCTGNDVGDTYVWDHGFVLDDLPAIHTFCIQEDARLRSNHGCDSTQDGGVDPECDDHAEGADHRRFEHDGAEKQPPVRTECAQDRDVAPSCRH